LSFEKRPSGIAGETTSYEKEKKKITLALQESQPPKKAHHGLVQRKSELTEVFR